jgi:pterin-4a-carbinolamine dehydratase
MERTTARVSGHPGPAAPTPVTARLKAERIQELLRELPGWTAARNATEISRRYTLSSPRAAVAFAHFVTETAIDHGMAADLDLRPNHVVVTLASRLARSLTEAEFDLAKAIDCKQEEQEQ